MTIQEAIKFIVTRNDDSLLKDSKKFKSYLLDLCSDNPKELKIINRALDDKILARIFGNDRDSVKIARLRDEFEDQGIAENWSEFIISSFAQVLGWNYEPKEFNTDNKTLEITYTEVALNRNILEELGYEIKEGKVNDQMPFNIKPIEKITKNGNEITSINIPATYVYNGEKYKITKIENYTFFQCKSLYEINIPSTVKSIGILAFHDCSELRFVTFNEGLQSIEQGAFSFCFGLKSIYIPKTVINIAKSAFDYGVDTVYYYGTAEGSPWGAKHHIAHNIFEGKEL